ncbi:MAG: amino acid transporter substrate-binding protein family [Hyphomicrobiales bacterium]|nr:amino acid transporter substrate-binding protein family [Hyphomicrobiales bacterium]
MLPSHKDDRACLLKVALFPSFFYTRSESGEFHGFGVAFAQAFAESCGQRLVLKEFTAPPAVVRALQSGESDLAFLGHNPAFDVAFTPPYLRADFTFVVPQDSAVVEIADVDMQDCRVAVVREHAMERALLGKLQRAIFVPAATPDEAFAHLLAGRADVSAGIRPGLLDFARRHEGFRVLDGRYGANVLALAVAKDQQDLLAQAASFILDARRSGLLQRIIEKTGLAGVEPVLN